ncbi:PAS domain-containing protein [Pontiellaceae bacterium B12227]|nr:PAS domain-containing protein [Pontiellaceae bacterium B12227]
MADYSFQDAKTIINELCKKAEGDGFPTRESFMDVIEANPDLAVQGYNAFCKIFLWNEASIRLYGYREDEAVNQDLTELVIPAEMRPFARDMISIGVRTGKMPDASACDLLTASGDFVTVYSGHLVFQWDNATTPEFYCIDLPIKTEGE